MTTTVPRVLAAFLALTLAASVVSAQSQSLAEVAAATAAARLTVAGLPAPTTVTPVKQTFTNDDLDARPAPVLAPTTSTDASWKDRDAALRANFLATSEAHDAAHAFVMTLQAIGAPRRDPIEWFKALAESKKTTAAFSAAVSAWSAFADEAKRAGVKVDPCCTKAVPR